MFLPTECPSFVFWSFGTSQTAQAQLWLKFFKLASETQSSVFVLPISFCLLEYHPSSDSVALTAMQVDKHTLWSWTKPDPKHSPWLTQTSVSPRAVISATHNLKPKNILFPWMKKRRQWTADQWPGWPARFFPVVWKQHRVSSWWGRHFSKILRQVLLT